MPGTVSSGMSSRAVVGLVESFCTSAAQPLSSMQAKCRFPARSPSRAVSPTPVTSMLDFFEPTR